MVEAAAVPVPRQIDEQRRRPRITHEPGPVDLVRAEKAATEMLAALGLPIDSADMFETPRRLVHAYAEMLTPPEFDFTTFANAARVRRAGAGHTTSRSGRSASTTCCRSPGSPTSATCRASASSACRSSPGPWSSSPVAPRPRSG